MTDRSFTPVYAHSVVVLNKKNVQCAVKMEVSVGIPRLNCRR